MQYVNSVIVVVGPDVIARTLTLLNGGGRGIEDGQHEVGSNRQAASPQPIRAAELLVMYPVLKRESVAIESIALLLEVGTYCYTLIIVKTVYRPGRSSKLFFA